MGDWMGQQLGNYTLMRLLGQGGFQRSIWASIFIWTRRLPSKFYIPNCPARM
jgi:hypothetical protein